METEIAVALSHKEFLQIEGDPVKAAATVDLVYVSDRQPGILRSKRGEGFTYVYNKRVVKDRGQRARIRRLVIPPAWKRVWICADDKGHIQATGLGLRGR